MKKINEYYIISTEERKMLITFKYKNFKSFKNENILDLEATTLKEHEYNVVKMKNVNLLTMAAIYGANASGKSNVLQAFEYMKNMILISNDSMAYSQIKEENIYSFMMNKYPISLEVEILSKDGKIYKYGFESLNDKIKSEWMYEKKINKFYTIFERKENSVSMKSNNKNNRYDNLDDKTLFLSIYTKIDRKNSDFNNVYQWFIDTDYLDLDNTKIENFINNTISTKILNDLNYKAELQNFISALDLGIEGIKTIPESMNDLPKSNGVVKIELLYRVENNKIKSLPLELESDGTRKMIYLFDYLIAALKKGMTLFIDDLDTKLHPLLTRYIINLFHNKEINISNAQLIYTTHDVTNLNKETFRRDEIWFTEKDNSGVSEIYSLSDYKIDNVKIRNDATFNKDYLTGRYGAIPELKQFKMDEI